MSNEDSNKEWSVNRRTILKGTAVSAVGLAGYPGLGAAKGKPCFKEFECNEDQTYVKFEFVIETDDDGDIEKCYFDEETDTGLITIDSFTSKQGEPCEPIEVEWSVAEGYGALKVMAYGGQDCVTATDPDPDQSFEPGLQNSGSNTAAISNLQFCVEELEEVELPANSYIGYEDRPQKGDGSDFDPDYDYNDFGMRASITENYLGGELQDISMTFIPQFHRANDSHDIHIERRFALGTDWELELGRTNHSAQGNEELVGTYTGSGTMDVIIVDTDFFDESDPERTITLDVTITSGSESPPTTSPRPDVGASNPLFQVYDPWMDNLSGIPGSGGNEVHLTTVEENISGSTDVKGTPSSWTSSDVPKIMIVPDAGFVAPAEGVTISEDYSEFDLYYTDGGGDTGGDLDVDDTYDEWYLNP